LRIAVTNNDQQLLTALLRSSSELGRQRRLAVPGLPRHKTDLALTFDHERKFVVELLQLFVSAYKDPIQVRCPLLVANG
jgi:hypothetical protein